MSRPAARLGDPMAHGGTISSGCPTVLIGGQPAARLLDAHVCPMQTPMPPPVPPIPHVGTVIVFGSLTVIVGMMPQARMGDPGVCIGPPNSVAMGCPTVLVGG